MKEQKYSWPALWVLGLGAISGVMGLNFYVVENDYYALNQNALAGQLRWVGLALAFTGLALCIIAFEIQNRYETRKSHKSEMTYLSIRIDELKSMIEERE